MSISTVKTAQPRGVAIREVVECRNGDVDRRNRPIRPGLGLAELDRPARIAVILPELGWLGFPGLRNAPLLDRLLLLLGVALLGGAAISEASTIWPPIAT